MFRRQRLFILVVIISVEKCRCMNQREVSTRVGVKMCEDICQQYPGFPCFRFSPESLMCMLVSSCKGRPKIFDSTKRCLSRSPSCRCIFSKTREVVCVEVPVPDENEGELVIAAFFTGRDAQLTLKFYNPSTGLSFGNIRSCRARVILDVLYVKKAHTVLITHVIRGKITVMNLKRNRCSDKHKRMKYGAMGFHRRQERVYILRKRQHTEICTLGVDGSDLKLKFKLLEDVYSRSMALDSMNDLIYLDTQPSLRCYTTDGHMTATFEISRLYKFHLNPRGTALYYAREKVLVEFSTLTNKSLRLEHCSGLPVDPISYSWFKDKLFLSFFGRCSFAIMEDLTCRKQKAFTRCKSGVWIASQS